jgi:hypothetical protein
VREMIIDDFMGLRRCVLLFLKVKKIYVQRVISNI